MRRFLIPILVVIFIIAAIVITLLLVTGGPKQAATTTYTVRTGTISATIRATGRVEPVRSLQLAFRSGGEVLRKIYVKTGDTVPAGTLLAELDSTSLERNLAQVEGQRDITRYNLSAAQERAASAPTSTPAANPTPTSQVPASFSDLYAAARQSELADLQLTAARLALEGSKLYAPFDGTVLAINNQEGEFVNGAFLTFADLRTLQVRADVDELDVPNAEVGQAVTVSLDAFPGRTFPGRITVVSPSATQRQGSSVYPAVVAFTQPPTVKLRPGMAANLNINSISKQAVVLVPTRAIETIGLRKFVTLLKTDNSSEKVPVEVGLTNGANTEIVSGLNSGDKISLPR